MKLILPLPPSMNRYWRAVNRGNILSSEARAYKQRAELVAAAQNTTVLHGPVSVQGTVFFKTKAGDLDNRIKPTLDSLIGVAYEDDKQVIHIDFRREIDRDNPRVELIIEEAA